MNSVPHPASIAIVSKRENATPNMVSLAGCIGGELLLASLI